MNAVVAPQSEELTRLEILRTFKKHFAGDGETNRSPFEDGLVVRYQTDVQAWDVPEIHAGVRQAIQEILQGIRAGKPSSVVILAGEPGMGKSHLLSHFRDPKRADEQGYVFVCNSNHWKVEEFEECLLDWIMEALVRPAPNEPHLLLEKVQEIAFQALSQIMVRPGQLRKYLGKQSGNVFRRLWAKMTFNPHGRFQQALAQKDINIFKCLEFPRFAGYVCDRFLHESGNPFHRYVLQVLLCYLFPAEREKVLHWLRGKDVGDHFLKKLGIKELRDKHYKVIDAIKIILSLFTPEVARRLNPAAEAEKGRIFFFAFDQMEGRQELFEQETDWFKFFAQLAELYNVLPNVFVLFTMSTKMRDRLYGKMEKQFRERIRRDQKFVLRELAPEEVLTIYRQRLMLWLGEKYPEERRLLEEVPRFRYLPFRQEDVLEFGRQVTIRGLLEESNRRFHQAMLDVTATDPRFEILVARNEFRKAEENAHPFHYTAEHLTTVTELMNRAGSLFASAYGLDYRGLECLQTSVGIPALRLEFHHPEREELWTRIFLVRLGFVYNSKLDGCVNLISGLHTQRNFLWLVRPDRVESSWEELKKNQVFARPLPLSTESGLKTILQMLTKRDQFEPEVWEDAEKILLEEFKLTYLGEMFQQVAEALEELKTKKQESDSK